LGLSVTLDAGGGPVESEPPEWAGIMRHYQSLGEHRSGTATDRETGIWLRSELQARGLIAEIREWPLRLFQLKESRIESEIGRFDAFPFWYPQATGAGGMEAPLVKADETRNEKLVGSIALFRLPPGQFEFHYHVTPILQQAAASGAKAAVVIIDHPLKAVSAQNAAKPHSQETLPLPAVIAAEADASNLLALAAGQAVVRLVIEGIDVSGMAANVIGRMDRQADQWVVVSTPISGWFEVTNERGPGIALWLQLAHWVVQENLDANFLFAGLSGHELGKLGMDALVKSGALPKPEKVALWLHLGSGIAVETPLLSAVSSTTALSETVGNTLIGPTAMTYWPEEKMPRGSEQYLALKLGYPVVGLFGAGPAIHTRLDQAVRVDGVEFGRVFRGLQELIRHQIAVAPSSLQRRQVNPIPRILNEPTGCSGSIFNHTSAPNC
jgi:hypothetical protein